jgi:hypothetical protein
MTKARVNADNASADIQGVTAGTGLSGGGTSGTVTVAVDTSVIQARVANVTDTEIGYLDGVTSAIQTQLNGKINNTLTTTTGDIIYASGANTPARLGIGSSGQLLSVSGGVPAWATPSGASDNFQLLGSASLTGSATVTVSGISGKNQLYILVIDASTNSTGADIKLRLNTDTANYGYFGIAHISGTGSTSVSNSNADGYVLAVQGGATNFFAASILVSGTNASGRKPISSTSWANGGGYAIANSGWYSGTSAISSISIYTTIGNLDDGTVYVYGA